MEIGNSNQGELTIKEISIPLFKRKGWLKHFGILMIVYDVYDIVGLPSNFNNITQNYFY